MRFTDYLSLDRIIKEVSSTSKEEVLEEIVSILRERGVIEDSEPYLTALLERERLCSTGIGRGVAIPHAKLKSLKKMLLSFVRSSKGVDFDSLDRKPVHFIFVIFTPEDVPEEYLVLLASISRLAKDESFRKAVMEATTEEEILRLFEEKDRELAKEDSG